MCACWCSWTTLRGNAQNGRDKNYKSGERRAQPTDAATSHQTFEPDGVMQKRTFSLFKEPLQRPSTQKRLCRRSMAYINERTKATLPATETYKYTVESKLRCWLALMLSVYALKSNVPFSTPSLVSKVVRLPYYQLNGGHQNGTAMLRRCHYLAVQRLSPPLLKLTFCIYLFFIPRPSHRKTSSRASCERQHNR